MGQDFSVWPGGSKLMSTGSKKAALTRILTLTLTLTLTRTAG
jgi:hypothetical protein